MIAPKVPSTSCAQGITQGFFEKTSRTNTNPSWPQGGSTCSVPRFLPPVGWSALRMWRQRSWGPAPDDGEKRCKFWSYELHDFFVGSASQAVPHVRDNESKGTSTIVSGAAKLSLVKARSYGRQSCHLDRQGHIENDKGLTAREMFLPAVERAATGFGSLRSFQDLKVWKSGHYWAD